MLSEHKKSVHDAFVGLMESIPKNARLSPGVAYWSIELQDRLKCAFDEENYKRVENEP